MTLSDDGGERADVTRHLAGRNRGRESALRGSPGEADDVRQPGGGESNSSSRRPTTPDSAVAMLRATGRQSDSAQRWEASTFTLK